MKYKVYIIGTDGNISAQEMLFHNGHIVSLQLVSTEVQGKYKLLITDTEGQFELEFTAPQNFRGLSLLPNSKDIFIEEDQIVTYNKEGSLVLYVNDTISVSPSTFTIECYKNTADFNRVDKTEYLELVRTYNGTLRESTSIIDPVITIQKSGVIDFNYIKIPTFNRYYYVADITSIATGVWEITFTIDVLMTYKNGLYSQSAFIDRNENYYTSKADMIDKKRIIFPGVNIETITLENDLFVELEDPYQIKPYTDRLWGGSLPYILSGYKITTGQVPHGYVEEITNDN